MVKNRYIKKYFGYVYSDYNVGKSGKQRRRNKRLASHIIRQKEKRQLKKDINERFSHIGKSFFNI